jgi:hypothetical protein
MQRSRICAVGELELPQLACPEASGVAFKIINTAKLLQLSSLYVKGFGAAAVME